MTEAEKRRIQLLHQTRALYSERRGVPAVHPRYQSVYKNIYGGQEKEENSYRNSTLGIRMIISVLLFAVFVIADYKKVEYAKIDCIKIVHEIERAPQWDYFP